MNNAVLKVEEPEEDRTPWFRARQDELISIIQAIDELEKFKPWRTLSQLVFEGVTENLEKRLQGEAKKDTPNNLEMARINGQLAWAKRYSSLNELSKIFKTELEGIKSKLKE
jgi:hypothetical protein